MKISTIILISTLFLSSCGGSKTIDKEKEMIPPIPTPISKEESQKAKANQAKMVESYSFSEYMYTGKNDAPKEKLNTEEYDKINENEFLEVLSNPQSTFSIDVDGASYSNARRFISQGKLPPIDAVRIEEFINYFSYDYPNPSSEHPFSIHTEVSNNPWNPASKLLHIGLQGNRIATENLPNSNLVFLLDVSGSMNSPSKLPLLKSSFKLLVDNLSKKDRIAIVVYAGAAGLVLPSTSCDNKEDILEALNKLESGGTTAGGAGIELAYKIANENFISEGNNRIILATDGDFNVGTSSNAELERLVEAKRETGIYLSVLGFGSGNYKDSKMEKLADQGNGNYYYIDSMFEAKKVLVNEMGGTLLTIAKDVKIQIEFNPAKVAQYRLIGYENRALANKDFDDDKKDAGELGSGHSVTALYEIIPANPDNSGKKNMKYKYITTKISDEAFSIPELGAIRFRYKNPSDTTSNLIEQGILDSNIEFKNTSNDFRFAASVAEFALLLRDSPFKYEANYEQVLNIAKEAKGDDKEAYRSDFIKLVEIAKSIAK
mgnify:FL=1|jgi:Ca-activated chloride channel family protein